MLKQHLQSVVPRILAVVTRSTMDDDRQFGRGSQLHLPPKDFFLHIARRVIVEVIKANLAPGNDLWILRQHRHLRVIHFRSYASLMRMQPRTGVNPVVLHGDLQSAIVCTRAGAAADGQNALQSGLTRASQHLRSVGRELVALNMGVGIDIQRESSLSEDESSDGHRSRRSTYPISGSQCNQWFISGKVLFAYLSFDPTGTSSRKLASTGLPSSPKDAATIMPLDSSPRSLRGARLATITTLRPISFSGSYEMAIPATTCRTSVPMSTSRRSSLSAPFTFSANFTSPTRISTFMKSSMVILPSVAAGVALGAGAPLAGPAAAWVTAWGTTWATG